MTTETESLQFAEEKRMLDLFGSAANLLTNHASVQKTNARPPHWAYELILEIQIPIENGFIKIHWEGQAKNAHRRLLRKIPKVEKVIFEKISVDSNKDGSGNPALVKNSQNGNVRYEPGGIYRDKQAIIAAIEEQIRLVQDYFTTKKQS